MQGNMHFRLSAAYAVTTQSTDRLIYLHLPRLNVYIHRTIIEPISQVRGVSLHTP